MAVGAFPIATDIPANRTWIESGKNGLLFQCGDENQLAESIVQALSQPKWRQSVMPESWEIVSRRTNWQSGMLQMENLYESLF